MEKQEYLKIAENVGLLIDTPQDTYEEAKFTMLCMASNISDSFCQFVTILFSVMDSYRPLLLEMKGEGKQSLARRMSHSARFYQGIHVPKS